MLGALCYSAAMIRIAVLIDGGHLRVLAKKAKLDYTPDLIEKVAVGCPRAGEETSTTTVPRIRGVSNCRSRATHTNSRVPTDGCKILPRVTCLPFVAVN